MKHFDKPVLGSMQERIADFLENLDIHFATETHNTPGRRPKTGFGERDLDFIDDLFDEDILLGKKHGPMGMMSAQHDILSMMEALMGTISLAGSNGDIFGLASSRIAISTGLDKNGKVYFHRSGNDIKTILLETLHEDIMKVAGRIEEIDNAMQTRIKKEDALISENRKIQEKLGREPIEINHTIWDMFPDYMGLEGLKIQKTGEVFQLSHNGNILDEVVPADFGADILKRQDDIFNMENRLSQISNERKGNHTWSRVKSELVDTLIKQLNNLLEEHHPDIAEKMIFISKDKKTGKPCVVINELIDETMDHIPAKHKNLILAALQDEEVPEGMLESLGVKPAVKELTDNSGRSDQKE